MKKRDWVRCPENQKTMNTKNGKQLSGKTALVTGGSRSLGAAIAKRLAVDGAEVALSGARGGAKGTAALFINCVRFYGSLSVDSLMAALAERPSGNQCFDHST